MVQRHASTRRRRYSERDHDVVTRERPNTEPSERHTYRVDLQADPWDNDSTRFYVEVHALGPNDARHQVALDHPGAGLRSVKRVD